MAFSSSAQQLGYHVAWGMALIFSLMLMPDFLETPSSTPARFDSRSVLEEAPTLPKRLLPKQIAASVSWLPTPPSQKENSQVSNSNRTVVVPLKRHSHALMVEADLNNTLSGNFILDTGATYTSITPAMADSLGIDWRHGPKILITTANGKIEVPKIVIEHLSVNGLEARNVEATVIDVHKNAGFSGLLGLSFIRQFTLTIDSDNQQLIFKRIGKA